jgi:hypothetical protein
MGLGLSVSGSIVEAREGKIAASPGKGLQFQNKMVGPADQMEGARSTDLVGLFGWSLALRLAGG